MNNDKRREYLTRDGIMRVLSDDEVARASAAETTAKLSDGEEYIDLEHLDRGVLRARRGATATVGMMIPWNAVPKDTWSKILTQLAPLGIAS